MRDWVPAVTMVGLALILGTTMVLRGPMGRALAEWIRGWSKTDEQWLALKAAKQGVSLSPDVTGEVEELKRRLAEIEERLDFAERLLAKGRSADRLGPPAAPAPPAPR
jgi:hypothetical protein